MYTPIHIGTSGWSYKHWRNIFYPSRLPSSSWLPYYAQTFPVTEINASFYRLPSKETVEKWVQQTPDDFLFCPKMSRYLTHLKKLREPEEPLNRFFEVFEPMSKKMGPVLVQLPPQAPFRYDIAAPFFELLHRQYNPYHFVLEARHPSWLHNDALMLMAGHKIGWVIAQSGVSFPYSEVVTAQTIYVRFHGPAALYASSYSDEQLQNFADKFLHWQKEGHAIWVFFNNDVHGYALNDAVRLRKLCQ